MHSDSFLSICWIKERVGVCPANATLTHILTITALFVFPSITTGQEIFNQLQNYFTNTIFIPPCLFQITVLFIHFKQSYCKKLFSNIYIHFFFFIGN